VVSDDLMVVVMAAAVAEWYGDHLPHGIRL
jgi:hypothetical protein